MADNTLIPKEIWDSHIHVFDPERFPYAIPRIFTPPTALFPDCPSHTTHWLHAAGVRGVRVHAMAWGVR